MKGLVFISHSSQEDELADMIRQRLISSGVECWVDHRDIPAGKQWPDVVLKAITDARVMVIVLSQSADLSPFVLREVDLAVSKGCADIIPLRLHQSVPTGALKFFLCTQHFMDALSAPPESRLDELISRILEIVGAATQADAPPDEAPPAGGAQLEASINPSKSEELAEFMRRCEERLEASGYKGGCMDRVLCVLSELLSNAAEHGCQFLSSRQIQVGFEVFSSHVKIIVKDSGPGFDATKTLEDLRQAADLLRSRGRGLLLVEHLSERFGYHENGRLVEAVVLKNAGANHSKPPDSGVSRFIGDVAILRIPERQDLPVEEIVDYLKPEFAMLKELGFLHFIVDWSSRGAAGSDTMACLMNNWREIVQEKGGSIIFINVSASLYHILNSALKTSGVAKFFPIKRSLADALCHLKISGIDTEDSPL